MTLQEQLEVVAKLKNLALRYCMTQEGRWITQIDWPAIPVELADLKGDVMGTYSFGAILLRKCPDANMLFGTYIHELRHRWQWEKHPFTYIIGKIYRPLIEKDACVQEGLADNWISA